MSRLEPLIALLLRGIASNINESVLGADSEFGIALNRDPVAHVRDSMLGEYARGVVRETGRERVALPGLGRVYAQLEKPHRLLFLNDAPNYSGCTECQSQCRHDFPLQHTASLVESILVNLNLGSSTVISC